MKIYPNKSTIAITKEVNPLTDIPLSYIDTNAIDYSINTLINEKYKLREKKEILPYDTVTNPAFCFFDEYGNQIPQDELAKNFQRNGKEYIYIPYGSQTFYPKKFKYEVIGKKSMNYSSNVSYNMNLLIANNPILANNFMPICGDAPNRLIAPANIFINNGDLSFSSLTESNMKGKDFAMLLFKNDKTVIEYDPFNGKYAEVDFDANQLINCYSVNLMAVYTEDQAIKDWEEDKTVKAPEKVQLKMSEIDNIYNVDMPLLHNSLSIETNLYFTVPSDNEKFIYHNIFNTKDKAPILIEEHIGAGFKIYIPESFIEKSVDNAKLLYNIMMKVYLSAYLKVSELEEWIADDVPDYIVSNKKLIKKDKFVSSIELHKMFAVGINEIKTYSVNIDESKYPFVKFTGMYQDYLCFEKNIEGDNGKYADPIKPEDAISIYTQKQNIMYFNKFIHSIDESIEDIIKVEKVDNSIEVNLKDFKHSSSGIYVKYIPETIIIPLIQVINNKEEQILNADFYLICKENDSASYFEIMESTKYESEKDGQILITIQVRQNSTGKIIYDMRQRGGGLPIGEPDVFDCFDIGNINGRPYRKASTLIITLPKYMEAHKETVMSIVKQYSVAEDYPIIIFKED